jgi:NADH-quinone oxidoreductase subunit G
LLINHPLDCPICDQAGECDLQNLSFEHGNPKTRFIEEKRTFEPEDIGPNIQLHMNRCILCQRCVQVADQLTDNRVHGVMDRGDHANISTCISKAIDNEFSGNMIDVCPVGALTDKTFRFKSRVWFNKPYNAHRDCDKCCGKTTVWMFGDEIQRITGRKDEYHEVEEFICNTCRFDKKEVSDWTIEGPRKFEKDSVINQNNYTQKLETVVIATEKGILKGRDQDRKKISMPAIPLSKEENQEFKNGNL